MLSDEYYTMHLTPHGWVEGTEKIATETFVCPIPDDAVLTLTFHEAISGLLSMPERRVEVKFFIDKSSDMLKILFATFGKLPERFKSWKIKVDW